jgi:hypothetical protein
MIRFFLLLLPLVFSSCLWKQERKNILILSIENFHEGAANCIGTEPKSLAENILCEEFVRFSHAYTTSTLAQPALASIMTGLYPFQHNVWNNGSSYLSEKHWTLAELAQERGMATSFFSGGGSIWRKSGLGQGFELFDEYDFYKSKKFYRDAKRLSDAFLRWEAQENDRSFFSVIHFTDLLFPTELTVDDLGVERARTKTAQLKEWKESASFLFSELKKRGIWDNSFIVIVGLNGTTPIDRSSEFSALDLHSENTQVGLYIKPIRKKRDKGLSWTIDTNVSLVDLGASLFDYLGQNIKSKSILKPISFLSWIENKKNDEEGDRPILMESAWGQWKGLSNTRSALMLGKKLFFYQEPIIYFNTLIDRKESIPIQWNESISESEQSFVTEVFQKAGLDIWSGVDYYELRKLKLGQVLWRDGLDRYLYDELRILSGKLTDNLEVGNWLAYHSLKEKNWNRLISLARAYGQPEWSYVALKNLKKKTTKIVFKNSCFEYLVNKQKNISQNRETSTHCTDKTTESLFQWRHGPSEKKNYWRESFISEYKYLLRKRKIAELNFVSGLVWDVDTTGLLEPLAIEMYLSLPENSFYRKLTKKRIEIAPF